MTTLLPTTLVGSLPKPSWLAQEESLWAPWKLSGDELQEGRHDALALAVADQLRAGVDLVCGVDRERTAYHDRPTARLEDPSARHRQRGIGGIVAGHLPQVVLAERAAR